MIVEEALRILIPRLTEIYGDTIVSIVLYGSYARNDHTDESDIDIALFFRSEPTVEMNDMMSDLVVDLELQTDKVLSLVKIDSKRYSDWADILPFYRNIRDQGVTLWKAA